MGPQMVLLGRSDLKSVGDIWREQPQSNLGTRTFMDTIGDLQPHIRLLRHVMATARSFNRGNISLYTSHMPEPISAGGEHGQTRLAQSAWWAATLH